jgi:hypothetical protein
VAQLYPRALVSLFVAPYDSQGLRWRYSNLPPHGLRFYVSEWWHLNINIYLMRHNRATRTGTTYKLWSVNFPFDRLCGLVVRVPDYISRFPAISGATRLFWEVVCLERGPLSLVRRIEELLGRKSSDSGLEIREYGSRDPSRWLRGNLYSRTLALTSPTSGRWDSSLADSGHGVQFLVQVPFTPCPLF